MKKQGFTHQLTAFFSFWSGRLRVATVVAATCIIPVFFNACAPEVPEREDKAVVKECVMPADQGPQTMNGNWRVTAVPIAFQQGAFSAEEIAEIIAAADVWNTFYSKSLGIKVIEYGPATGTESAIPRPAPGTLCTSSSAGVIQGNAFVQPIVIYKVTDWKHDANAIALTTTCPYPAKPYQNFYAASMEANYQYFFTGGNKIPDLKSIFVHEFGHLLGLNHSCDSSGAAGFPNCNGSIPQSYVKSVVFPQVLFNGPGNMYGEKRTSLTDNDQGRANCLYQEAAASAKK